MKVILISGKAQHGKDSSAQILKEFIEKDNKKVLITHYADLLKYICKTYFNWNGVKDKKGRKILQQIGTDTIRKINPDYWVDFVGNLLLMFKDYWDYVIIPDCRFPNEIEKMNDLGFDCISIRVNRIDYTSNLTEEQKRHPSETALDNYSFDYRVDTISGFDYLRKSLSAIYEEIKGGGIHV